jgi:glutathione-regulated potassium-efflux system ancillary protein KefF
MAEIVVLTAHPRLEHSRINMALMKAAQKLASERVLVRDLYALYPDYLIDIQTERRILAAAKLVVWQFPLHWYSMPPMLKLWLDEVFGFGWAYGPGGTALRGKDLWPVISTGGAKAAYTPEGYNRFDLQQFLLPLEQTATLADMRYLPPLVLHGAHQATDRDIRVHANRFIERLTRYPQWPEMEQLPNRACPCDIPADARPIRPL